MGNDSGNMRRPMCTHAGVMSQDECPYCYVEHFDGITFDPALDGKRLTSQLERVRALMRDGKWRTLAEIHAVVGGSEAGISARLRDLRKLRFGWHTVDKMRTEVGWLYCMIPRQSDMPFPAPEHFGVSS